MSLLLFNSVQDIKLVINFCYRFKKNKICYLKIIYICTIYICTNYVKNINISKIWILFFIKYIHCVIVTHSKIFENYLKNKKEDIVLIVNKFFETF